MTVLVTAAAVKQRRHRCEQADYKGIISIALALEVCPDRHNLSLNSIGPCYLHNMGIYSHIM